MKKNKKRLYFMIVVVIMILSIASTSFAATYSGLFRYSISQTENSVSLENYVKDDNAWCKIYGEATYGTYISKGLCYDGGWVQFHEGANSSGNTIKHVYNGDPTSGKLGFYNSWCYGTLLAIYGQLY